jgi:hypothetical protein
MIPMKQGFETHVTSSSFNVVYKLKCIGDSKKISLIFNIFQVFYVVYECSKRI